MNTQSNQGTQRNESLASQERRYFMKLKKNHPSRQSQATSNSGSHNPYAQERSHSNLTQDFFDRSHSNISNMFNNNEFFDDERQSNDSRYKRFLDQRNEMIPEQVLQLRKEALPEASEEKPNNL